MILHFIGIGGIGMSALARYYLSKGAKIRGSDLSPSEITDELIKLGCEIKIGPHKRSNLSKKTEAVIYNAAISPKNPELEEAKKRKLAVKSYAEALGELTKNYKTITVSGAHGKSTTTAMAALVLEAGHCDPLVIVGAKVKEFGNSNFRPGLGGYFVLEADEYNKSFLNYHPSIAVLTNIDAEHLDTYKNIDNIEKAFKKFLSRLPKNGVVVANADDKRVKKIAVKSGRKILWYSLSDKEAAILRSLLAVPGEHNVSNALAALRVGQAVGVSQSAILRALERFKGTWRRFEFRGIINQAPVFDDYAHHPNEIRATLAAAKKKFPYGRVISVFQPHQRRRLSAMFDDFVNAFENADMVCLLDVYEVPGRDEIKIKNPADSFALASAISQKGKDARHFNPGELIDFLKLEAKSNDAIIFMGAGNVYKITASLFEKNEF